MPSKAFRNLGAGSTVRAMDTWGHENGCTMLGPGVAHQRQACFIAAPKPILDGWTTAALFAVLSQVVRVPRARQGATHAPEPSRFRGYDGLDSFLYTSSPLLAGKPSRKLSADESQFE